MMGGNGHALTSVAGAIATSRLLACLNSSLPMQMTLMGLDPLFLSTNIDSSTLLGSLLKLITT